MQKKKKLALFLLIFSGVACLLFKTNEAVDKKTGSYDTLTQKFSGPWLEFKSKLKTQKSTYSERKETSTTLSIKSLLTENSQGPLFTFLFSERFRTEWNNNKQAVLELVAERLFQPLPSGQGHHESQIQRELRVRMSLIQALSKLNSAETLPLLIQIIRSTEQHWILRWLSLRGIQQIPSATNQEEFLTQIYADLDPQIIQLAQLNEDEILNRIVSNEK